MRAYSGVKGCGRVRLSECEAHVLAQVRLSECVAFPQMKRRRNRSVSTNDGMRECGPVSMAEMLSVLPRSIEACKAVPGMYAQLVNIAMHKKPIVVTASWAGIGTDVYSFHQVLQALRAELIGDGKLSSSDWKVPLVVWSATEKNRVCRKAWASRIDIQPLHMFENVCDRVDGELAKRTRS